MSEKTEWLMDLAKDISKRSTCAKIKVGAIIVKEGRIVLVGYNGSAPGREHCEDHFDGSKPNWNTFLKEHHIWSIKNELHAEINAIIFAAKHGISIDNCTMYITHMPCTICSKYIVQSGIRKVYYNKDYDGITDCDIFVENFVEVIRV